MADIKEAVGKLARLQGMDTQLSKMKAAHEEKPRLIAHEQKLVDEARAALAAAEGEVREHQKKADAKELDIQTAKAQITKLEGQLNTATSNKVYSDLLLAIAGQKAEIEKLEEQILRLMDETEELESSVEERRTVLKAAESEFEAARVRLQAEADELAGQIDAKQKIRDHLAGEVDAEVLGVYERVAPTRAGVAVTEIEVDADGHHFCSTCQMEVNLQDVSVALGGGRLVQCRSCNRILHVETLPTRA